MKVQFDPSNPALAVNGSAGDLVAVTPSDTTVLSGVRGLYVGGTGNVSVQTASGRTVTFYNVPSGKDLAVSGLTKVFASGTTATNIVAYQ